MKESVCVRERDGDVRINLRKDTASVEEVGRGNGEGFEGGGGMQWIYIQRVSTINVSPPIVSGWAGQGPDGEGEGRWIDWNS